LTRAPAAQTIVAGCRLWVEAVEKILRGPPSNIDSRQTLNAQVGFNKFPRDSIVARRWHAADFFNSIGHRPLSRPCAGSVCSSFNSGRNAVLHYPPASCQQRTRALQQTTCSLQHHSINSSARPDRGSGTAMPSALAVLRLRKSSTLVARWTGSSLGFSPFRIRAV
jgi:hypothetical protein